MYLRFISRTFWRKTTPFQNKQHLVVVGNFFKTMQLGELIIAIQDLQFIVI